MTAALGFLVAIIASLLDPISLIGYVLAGIFLRRYWAAVLVSVAWRLILQLVFIVPMARSLQSGVSTEVLAAALVGAFVATSIVYLIAKRVRAPREKPTSLEVLRSPEPKELLFNSASDALSYACKYMDNTYGVGSLTPALVDQIWEKSQDDMLELGLFVAGKDGPEPVTAFAPKSLRITIGDLLGCTLIPRSPHRPFVVVECKLKPEYDLRRGGWQVDRHFRRDLTGV